MERLNRPTWTICPDLKLKRTVFQEMEIAKVTKYPFLSPFENMINWTVTFELVHSRTNIFMVL